MSSTSVVVGMDLQLDPTRSQTGNTDLNNLNPLHRTLADLRLPGKLSTMVPLVAKCILHIHNHRQMLTHITDQNLLMRIRLMDCHILLVDHL